MKHVVFDSPTRVPSPAGLVWDGRMQMEGMGEHSAVFVRFDVSGFDPASFVASNMPCPPSVARAVLKRQADYFFGRWAARRACAAVGIHVREIGTGPAREPLWPAGVRGSISHSHGLAMAVAVPSALCKGVGIDVERIAGVEALAAIKDTVLSAREMDLLERHKDIPLSMLLTLVFSAKECLFKAAYPLVGRYFDFSAVQVVQLLSGERIIELRIVEDLCAGLRPGDRVRVRYQVLMDTWMLTHLILD